MDVWKLMTAALLCVGLATGCPRKHHGRTAPPKCPIAQVAPAAPATPAPPLLPA